MVTILEMEEEGGNNDNNNNNRKLDPSHYEGAALMLEDNYYDPNRPLAHQDVVHPVYEADTPDVAAMTDIPQSPDGPQSPTRELLEELEKMDTLPRSPSVPSEIIENIENMGVLPSPPSMPEYDTGPSGIYLAQLNLISLLANQRSALRDLENQREQNAALSGAANPPHDEDLTDRSPTITPPPSPISLGSTVSPMAGSPSLAEAGSPLPPMAGSPLSPIAGSPSLAEAGSPLSPMAGSPSLAEAGAPTFSEAGSPSLAEAESPPPGYQEPSSAAGAGPSLAAETARGSCTSRYHCETCSANFVTRRQMKKHACFEFSERCENCARWFSHPQLLLDHICIVDDWPISIVRRELRSGILVRVFCCNLCGRIFTTYHAINNHMTKQHP